MVSEQFHNDFEVEISNLDPPQWSGDSGGCTSPGRYRFRARTGQQGPHSPEPRARPQRWLPVLISSTSGQVPPGGSSL